MCIRDSHAPPPHPPSTPTTCPTGPPQGKASRTRLRATRFTQRNDGNGSASETVSRAVRVRHQMHKAAGPVQSSLGMQQNAFDFADRPLRQSAGPVSEQ
eukprot:3772531-Rhodomonas_salina.2